MNKIVVSILHYNSVKDTLACLDSLLKADFNNIDITTYVLDNASSQPLNISGGGYKSINLKILVSKENLGFTGGHNFIYKSAEGEVFDYFLLLNNDSLVSKDFIQKMISSIDEDKIGAVVPKIYFTKGWEFHKNRYKPDELGKVIWYAGGSIDWDNVTSVHRGIDEVDRGQYDNCEEVSFATGACILIRKKVIGEIRLFDDKYFLYYEDADLSTRIVRHGYKILYIPNSVVWHNNAGSSGSGSELHDYYLTRNRMLFGMRYAPLRTKVALFRESFRLISYGRKWQRIGVKDYFIQKLGKGSYVKK